MKKRWILFWLLFHAASIYAKPAFTGHDFSGQYDCTGEDSHEGQYTGTVTMQRVPAQSTQQYGAYTFKLEVPGYGTYLGEAAAHDTHVAMHFALTNQSTQDYGTGIAKFKKNQIGKWTFVKYYFEPAFKGGNYGIEECTHR